VNPKGSLICSREPVTGCFLRQLNPVHSFISYFFNVHFSSLLRTTPWVVVSYLRDLGKMLHSFFMPPCTLHAPPIFFSFIRSPY
jgi:hypothetical protein